MDINESVPLSLSFRPPEGVFVFVSVKIGEWREAIGDYHACPGPFEVAGALVMDG